MYVCVSMCIHSTGRNENLNNFSTTGPIFDPKVSLDMVYQGLIFCRWGLSIRIKKTNYVLNFKNFSTDRVY